MNLLGAILYDPTTAVSKATTAAIAMTAIDTTNLRLTVTVPAHGRLRIRLMACLHGATTFPSILMGAINGATVVGRVAPVQSLGNTAVATALVNVEADFIVTGLTPGSITLDAAYGVETLVAATGLKYGGPNNTTANDAFGAFVFEIWDPTPVPTNWALLSIDANGRIDVSKVLGTAQTAGDLKASLNTLQTDTDDIQTRLPAALVSGRMDSSVGAMAANALTAAAINAAALNGKGDWSLASDYTAARAGKLDNLDATVSSRSTYAGGAVASVTGNVGGNVTGSVASVVATVNADVKKVNAVTLAGDGSATPWGPA